MASNTVRRFPKITRLGWVLFGVVVVLIIARAALPWAIKTYVNKTLDEIPGYDGRIEDVDVALWRGAYRIEDLRLVKTKGDAKEPFFSSNAIEISLDWSALFNGRLKTSIALSKPELQFIQRESKEASQTGIDESWQNKVQKLYPFEINTFRITDGLVRYRDTTRDPKINVYFHDMNLVADNISNAERSEAKLPSTIKFDANLLKSGKITARAKVNALAEPFETDLNVALRDLSLKELNDFTKAYAGFDFANGNMQVTTELAASKTKYDGYVKTLMKDVDIVDLSKEQDQGDSVGKLIWEGLVGAAMEIFENQSKDQFAARIPIGGSREDLEINSWATVGSILKNAFFSAMNAKLEDSVQYEDATTSATTRSAKDDDGSDEKKEENKKEDDKK